MQSPLDPITLEIIRGAIRAAQAEMEALLERTAICAFIREKKDFYTALFDADGVMAVGSMVPIFGDITGPVFARLPARHHARGRSLLVQRLLRLARRGVAFQRPGVPGAGVPRRQALRPSSWAGRISPTSAACVPGSISPDTTDIFQEGIIIPPTKLIDAGATNEAALEIFYRNSRYPRAEPRRHARADGVASIWACGAWREILARFGPDVVADAFAQLVRRARATWCARKLRETFPVGTHRFTDAIDSDGHGNGPFFIRLALTRDGRTTASSSTPRRPTTRRPAR